MTNIEDALRQALLALNAKPRFAVPGSPLGDSYTIAALCERAIAEIEAGKAGHSAAELLVHAYAKGEANGGSVDWEDIGAAHTRAYQELGEKRALEIISLYEEEAEPIGDDEPDNETPDAPHYTRYPKGQYT